MDTAAYKAVATLHQVTELAAVFAGHPVVREAELAARGIWPVSVVYGHGRRGEDAARVHRDLAGLARTAGTLVGQHTGSGYATFLFSGRGADEAASAFAARLTASLPRWWQITRTAWLPWPAQ